MSTSSADTIYGHYCMSYAIAATGGGAMVPLSNREEHLAAVMLGAADGLNARQAGMFRAKGREEACAEVLALLAPPAAK